MGNELPGSEAEVVAVDPRARALATTLLWVVAITAALALLFAAMVAAQTSPHEADGVRVGSSTCRVGPTGEEAVVWMDIEPIDSRADGIAVRQPASDSVSITATGLVDANDAAETIDPTSLAGRLPEGSDWMELPAGESALVIVFQRTSPSATVSLPEISVGWTSGEVGYVQRIPLDLEWSGAECRVMG